MTGFGSFDNSTCKRVLDLLEPGDLRLGQVVIKRVAVVKLGVNDGSGDGGSCFGIEVWTDTAKLTNMAQQDLETIFQARRSSTNSVKALSALNYNYKCRKHSRLKLVSKAKSLLVEYLIKLELRAVDCAVNWRYVPDVSVMTERRRILLIC